MIQFNNLGEQWKVIKDDATQRMDILFEKSSYINGPDVKIFEENFAKYIGTKYAVGVSNGTDAIKLSVEALELKGKTGIIIPANTFIATILGAEMSIPDAEFVLVDVDEYYQIDVKELDGVLKSKRGNWDNCIILPVHLYGHSADIVNIMKLANEYNCYVIEDSSQAHGTQTNENSKVGSYGIMSAFSLYPGKNLGAAGDAGIITTNDEELYQRLKYLQNWGSKVKYYYESKGYNNRLDTIQAIILDEKLKHLDDWNNNRNNVANFYNSNIDNKSILPKNAECCNYNSYHVYPVLVDDRESFMKYLNDAGIPTIIHYPIPIELTKPYEYLNFNNPKTRSYCERLVSLPIHPFMETEELEYIVEKINNYYVSR